MQLIAVWLKRWRKMARIKTLADLNDERMIQFCSDYGDMMAGRRMKEDEQIAGTIVFLPTQDPAEIRALFQSFLEKNT